MANAWNSDQKTLSHAKNRSHLSLYPYPGCLVFCRTRCVHRSSPPLVEDVSYPIPPFRVRTLLVFVGILSFPSHIFPPRFLREFEFGNRCCCNFAGTPYRLQVLLVAQLGAAHSQIGLDDVVGFERIEAVLVAEERVGGEGVDVGKGEVHAERVSGAGLSSPSAKEGKAVKGSGEQEGHHVAETLLFLELHRAAEPWGS